MGDRIFGGLGLALAAFFIWNSTLIQLSFISDPVGPKAFPIIVGVLLAIASLFIMLRPDANPNWPKMGGFIEIVLTIVVLVLYAYLLPIVGFLIATAVASAFLGWRLGATPLQSVFSGIGTSVGIYVVFNLILGLSLAKGPFGF